MTTTPDPRHIDSIRTANLVIGGKQIIIVDGQRIEPPTMDELVQYLIKVRAKYGRWADQPDNGHPLAEQQDIYVETRALPMRLAQYQPLPTDNEAPSKPLLEAVANAQRAFILGEPGAGKTAALERLAWVTATKALRQINEEPTAPITAPITVPLLARLADYGGGDDLTSLLRRSINDLGPWDLGDAALKMLLWAQNVRWLVLLDGLNELDQAHARDGQRAIRNHLHDFGAHTVHLSCRTADFDHEREQNPELQLLRNAQFWTVQELLDDIPHWDAEGESDVRQYLRFHLGDGDGKRVYEHLHSDDRLTTLARIPLFLWMFRTTAQDGHGALPSDRGELLRDFVHSHRVLGRVPQRDRVAVERCLECVGWTQQQAGSLQTDLDTLYAALEEGRGKRSYELDTLRDYLKLSGLLIEPSPERYKLLHQLVQEYAAAAYLLRTKQASEQIPILAQDDRWRETCIAALWLDKTLHTPDYLFGLMWDHRIDLRVRVEAAIILGEAGDTRFEGRPYANGVEAIEPWEMIPIPAGLATLGGADPEAHEDEKPECQVPVAAFELAVYPVTNAEFACFVNAKGYEDERLWTAGGKAWLRGEGMLDPETEQQYRGLYRMIADDVEGLIADLKQTTGLDDAAADAYRGIAANFTEDEFVNAYVSQILGEQRHEPYYWRDSRFNQPNQPVVGVNWYEAMAYATWLTNVAGKHYRLPAEAEWEWAARRNQRRYPWGNDWDGERCNWRASGLNKPNPVGVYPHGATDDGLHELAGNVDEWTLSLYRPYEYDPKDGREDVDVDGLRVARGGSWYTDKDTVRCAYRGRFGAWNWVNNYGFRLARISL